MHKIVDVSLTPVEWTDDLPILFIKFVDTNSCMEFWSFDWDDVNTHSKGIIMLKRFDSHGNAAIHLEFTTHDNKEYKFYKTVSKDFLD